MIFEQCKVGRYFAWAGRDPGIKSPMNESDEVKAFLSRTLCTGQR